ncbi:MAG: geranylgeranylglyceryl/heptaprenylglyceryl phosphate synthase [Flavobacteriales bacterium]|nr:geranylgeranylglyceryl/heptaprenylglyceryl phosphate synthase [Flavobacteriales bacterium]
MIYQYIQSLAAAGKKMLAVLIDPGKTSIQHVKDTVLQAKNAGVDFILVGGSLMLNQEMDDTIQAIKQETDLPVLIFPGSTIQISSKADAILFLSLISGRNPDLLIGRHVESAMLIKQIQLEAIPTAYILIDGKQFTSVQYISQTLPLPSDKPDIAIATAVAGEMLGMKMIYMDAGSGALEPVPEKILTSVKKHTAIPIWVGGGIRNPEQAIRAWQSGADIVVVGNAVEENLQLIKTIASSR